MMTRISLTALLCGSALLALTPSCGSPSGAGAEGTGASTGTDLGGASGDTSDPKNGDTNIAVGANSGKDDGTDAVTSCAEGEAAAELVPANLLFVVDKSGSMNCNAPPIDSACLTPEKVNASEPSKWEITQQALTGASGALQTLAGQDGVSVGLLTFPTDNHCAIPEEGVVTVPMSQLDTPQLDALTVGLTQSANGDTPLAGAAIRGLEYLRQQISDGTISGKHYLVLMTDGSETCQIDALKDLLWFVEQAHYYYGVTTYAIGAPGSEDSRALLSEIAVLGGSSRSDSCKQKPTSAAESCHIDLTESNDFASDLGTEFSNITNEAAKSCEYDVPQGALIDPTKVNVEYTPAGGEPELVPRDPRLSGTRQCENADGWQFNPDASKIVLCGDLCDSVLANPESSVRVIFGCRDTYVR